MLRVFIGYDDNEPVAYHVLAHSIMRQATRPIAITPLSLNHLKGVFKRERDPLQSTDFAFTRFLVPFLCDYQGFAVFMDCDMLCRMDLTTILDGIHINKAVALVKHDHQVGEGETKFLGHPQTPYKYKNWSSMMVFDNGHEFCKRLTPTLVNMSTGLALHQFEWCPSAYIDSLPSEYNHLVGVQHHNPDAKIVHYTLGGPYFQETDSKTPFYEDWWDECRRMTGATDGSVSLGRIVRPKVRRVEVATP